LAKELEVASKTVQRDIVFMREQLSMPLEYDDKRFGYYYTRPVESVPGLQVSQGELVALLIAQKALDHNLGKPFEAPLRSACMKIADSMGEAVSVDLGDLDEAISFRKSGSIQIDSTVFQLTSQAVTTSRELSFLYSKLTSDVPEKRRVRPYHLACISQQWYLFAFDIQRDALRTFVLARMGDTVLERARFKRPLNFSIDRLLSNSLDVFQGGDVTRKVRIRFDAWAAKLVRERMWHASQRLTNLPGGRLEVTFDLANLEEVERWVLGYGARAQAIEPPELVERLRKNVQRMLELYSS
jgi:proteasome accessory factor B